MAAHSKIWRHVVQLGVEREPMAVLVRFLRFLIDFKKGFAQSLAIIAKKSWKSMCWHIDASTRFDGKIDRCVDVYVEIQNRYGSRPYPGLTTWWFWRDGGSQHRLWTLNYEWKLYMIFKARCTIMTSNKDWVWYIKWGFYHARRPFLSPKSMHDRFLK